MRAVWIAIFLLTLRLPAAHLWSQQAPDSQRDTQAAVDYDSEVQPILKASCYGCHSGAKPPAAGLRLDVRSLALTGGNAGPVIQPGDSKASLLISRVSGLGGLRPMPPSGTSLSPDQIALLARWIDQGAHWPDAAANEANAGTQKHWAYLKAVRPALPSVKETAWVRNPIDNFVLARLEQEGLRPSAEGNRETLIRRLSLDLTGLPPTLAEVDAFTNDKSPDAYERLVDRLMSSPQYGVRMATPWLDLARYADSNGMTNDRQRPGAYHYRDWVVKALNDNMPFDRFIVEQLAGDLLPHATTDQKVATGFVRASMWNDEGGTDPEEQHWITQIDRANTLGTALLGSTLLCAQCHNHKYDPFTQKDYYGIVAFFNNGTFDSAAPRKFTEVSLELSNPEQAARRDLLKAELKAEDARLKGYPTSEVLWKAWERSILDADNRWTPLQPTHATSSRGSLLEVSKHDGSILVSGPQPDNDVYAIEAKTPIVGSVTGFQIEALLDAALPNGRDPAVPLGGPGRDFYGNFMVHRVDIETRSRKGTFSKVPLKPTVWPAGSDEYNPAEYQIHYQLPQVWRSDVMVDLNPQNGGVRVPRRLVLVPAQPLSLAAGDVLRITIVHDSELPKAALGKFRLSLTTQSEPLKVVEVSKYLRPLLRIPWEQRPRAKADVKPGGPAATAETQAVTKLDEAPRPPYEEDPLFRRWREVAPELAQTRDRIAALFDEIDGLGLQPTPVLTENPLIAHPKTHLRIRGAYTDKADDVAAAVPVFLGSLPSSGPQNRLGLARWLVGSENPLTARVRANQLWEIFFGRGLVETSEDFGTAGSRPSHPELLDWLATEFTSNGWDQKALQKLIVTSSTYRQTSKVTPELLERDPANVLFTRGSRFRVEAEMVRDIALAAAGLLSTKIGGPPVMPPQPAGLWEFPGQNETKNDVWLESKGEDRYRRALYTFVRRSIRYPSMTVFDATSHEVATARRARTNTPLQALTTLNDPAFFEAAQAMARRIVRTGVADDSSRAVYGFRLVTSQRPTQPELKTILSMLEDERSYFRAHQAEARGLAGSTDPELAAWTMVSNALLNLDGTVTKK